MDEPSPKHVNSLSCIACYVFCGIFDHSIYLMLEGFIYKIITERLMLYNSWYQKEP